MQSKNYSHEQTVLKSLLTSLIMSCCLFFTNNVTAQIFETAYMSQEHHSGYSVLSVQNNFTGATGGYIMAGTAFDAGMPEPAPSWIDVIEVDANGLTVWNKHYDLGSYAAKCFNINHTPDGYIISGMVTTANTNNACLIHIDFNGNIINSVIYNDGVLGVNSQALHTVFSYNDFSFTTVGFVNDDNYDNTGNKQAFVLRSDYNLNVVCDRFFDTPQIAGAVSTDYDMAEHVTELQGADTAGGPLGFFITGSMNAPANYNKQGVLALRIDNNCNLVANGSFSSSNSTEAGVSAVFDGQRIHLLSNNSAIHNFELTTFNMSLNILNHVGFSPCCDNYAGFSLRQSPNNANNLVIAGHIRSTSFVDETGTMNFDNSPPFLLEVEKVSGTPVTAGIIGTHYKVVNNFNGVASYRDYGGFYQPFTGQQPFIFTPEMLTVTPNGEYALVSHRTNFSSEIDVELIKTDMFGKATDCQEDIIFSPFSQNYIIYNSITTNVGLSANYPTFMETDLMPTERPACEANIYPCDDPAIYGAVALNLTDLGGNVIDADLNLPAGASLINWTVDFGDGNPPTTYVTHPIIYTYASAGFYTVCAWGTYAINGMICDFQVCKEIVINSDPCLDVHFTYTSNPTAANTFDFTATYGGSLTLISVDWIFGDGNTATGNPITHTYTSGGSYFVCAVFTFASSDGTIYMCEWCEEIFIDVPCDPSLVTLNLTDLGSGVVQADLGLPAGASFGNWTIDFGDGNPPNTYGTSPVNYTYVNNGVYVVCVWGFYIINNMECFFQICNEIEIVITEPYEPCLNNLVINGDFENGNDGSFTTGTLPFAMACQMQSYAVVNNATDKCGNVSVFDHTNPPFGLFLDVDGYMSAAGDVWCQNVSVTPFTNYTFSFWATDFNIADMNPNINMVINGSVVNAVSVNTNTWTQYTATWNSGSTSGTISLCLHQTNFIGIGVDYGIDDIEFCATSQNDPCVEANLDINLFLNGSELGVSPFFDTSIVAAWEIDFGDGYTTGMNTGLPYSAIHTYSTGGFYTVCLYVWIIDPATGIEIFCEICEEIFIETTNPCTNVDLGLDLFANGLELGVSPFFDTSVVSAWEINFGDGYTTGMNTGLPYSAIHTYNAGGFYTVCLFVWITDPLTGVEKFCEICETIYIDPCTSNPPLDFDIWVSGTNVDVCPIITTTAPMGVISWNWNFGDGSTASDTAPSCQTYTYNGAGMYVICLTVLYEMNDGTVMECVVCKEVFIDDWCINTGVILEYQQNTHVGFLPTVIPDFHYEFTWDFGDGTTYTTDQIGMVEHSYTAAGTYTVCLMIVMRDATGNIIAICYHYITIVVTDPCFGFDLALSGTVVSCNANNGALTAAVVGGTAPYTYTWTNNQTNQSATAGAQIGNLAAGSYTVVVTDANGCTTTATTILVQEDCGCVAIPPTGLTTTINWPQVTLAWNPVPNVAQYQLAGRKLGGNVKIFPPQTATFRTFNSGISPNSTYQWAVRSICPDGSVSDWSAIETFTTPNAKNASQSIADPFETNETALTAKAYPNPAINNLTVEYTLGDNTWSSNENINITISDLLGRTVISQTVENQLSNNKLDIDISQLSTGTYILQIDNGIDKHIEKLSVAH